MKLTWVSLYSPKRKSNLLPISPQYFVRSLKKVCQFPFGSIYTRERREVHMFMLCCISHRDDRWEISYKKSDYKWNRFITDVVITLSCWVASKALILSSLLSEKQSIQLAVDIQFENEVTINAMEKTLSQTAKVKKIQQDWSNRISWLNCAHIFELRIVWSDLINIKHCIPKELDFQIHVVVW